MTEIEYKKMRMERRKKSRELLERAKSVGFVYPPDLHYLWEYMQDKNIGLPFCLGMIYQLGYSDAKKAVNTPTDQSEVLTATHTTTLGCYIHSTMNEPDVQEGDA